MSWVELLTDPYYFQTIMLETNHRVIFSDSRDLQSLPRESIDLIVTSPPYPMIQMWDDVFVLQNHKIGEALKKSDGRKAFELMHGELDRVWTHCYRILKTGGILCINIGDATRTIGDKFQLYPNHSRILSCLLKLRFDVLPVILWRKQTNAPNKFMGSGMLPAGAYVTLEHEYILLLRKGNKRDFTKEDDRIWRRQSAFFWEERNRWFSDIWDFKGIRQDLGQQKLRKRSAAFPFELAYRLINMYSLKGDTVMDPFLGTGSTLFAAMASCRNSIGVEIDQHFQKMIISEVKTVVQSLNNIIACRLQNHLLFVKEYENTKGNMKHMNMQYHFPVVTRQETDISIHYLKEIQVIDDTILKATYYEEPSITPPCNITEG